jgi:hypothetical protein
MAGFPLHPEPQFSEEATKGSNAPEDASASIYVADINTLQLRELRALLRKFGWVEAYAIRFV